MADFWEHGVSWLAGFLSGFLLSIPVGPINVTIINEGGRRGLKWGLLIGAGAVLMELIYCTLGFSAFANFFSHKLIKASMELVSFLLMLLLGLKYLLFPSVEASLKTVTQFEETLHPHSAFMTGFVRVLGNPMVLLGWITLAATFVSHEWVDPNWASKSFCIAGVGMGCAVWFIMLSYAVTWGHKKLSTKILARMSQLCGASLLCMAVGIGIRIITRLARN